MNYTNEVHRLEFNEAVHQETVNKQINAVFIHNFFSLYLLVVTTTEWQEGGDVKHDFPAKNVKN